jgi:hypothetical protein
MSDVPDSSTNEAVEKRRKSLRKRVDIPCALRMSAAIYSGRLLDISLGGAFIQTREILPIGSKFALVFKVQIGTKRLYFSFRAEAVHSGRFVLDFENFGGIGARFINLTRKHAEELVFLINNLHAEPPKKKFEITS